MIRVIVTASRTWTDPEPIRADLDQLLAQHGQLVVAHGDAKQGGDRIAAGWGARKPRIIVEAFPAKWKLHGRVAGIIRNTELVAAGADLCLAYIRDCNEPTCPRFRPHGSHGATHCADLAERAGIETRRTKWNDRRGQVVVCRD